jgi:hypothetical protein
MPFRRLIRGKPVILGFCLCFALGILFSQGFISNNEGHDCPGGGCPLCPQIQSARNFLGQLRHTVFQIRFPPGAFLITALILKPVFLNPVPVSAVTLKVKMNN